MFRSYAGKQYRQQSFMSLLVYLNEFPGGGGTTNFWMSHEGIHCRFLRDAEDKPPSLVVEPEVGKALIMDQNLLHEGSPPKKGVKYILRTDIMHEKMCEGGGVNDDKLAKELKKVPKRVMEDAKRENKCVLHGEWERIFESSCKNYAD